MLLVWYPKCSTCQKAKAWLDGRGVGCDTRDIKPVSYTHLQQKSVWFGMGILFPSPPISHQVQPSQCQTTQIFDASLCAWSCLLYTSKMG